MSKTCIDCKISFNLDNFYKGSNQCKKCKSNKSKCEHDKIKRQCRDCGGSLYCEHDIRRAVCKECKGSSICEHDKIRNSCRECNGSAFCEHDKIKSICRECKGSRICEHDKIRSRCRYCKGASICEHDKVKSQCRDCGGSSICEHNIRKSVCRDCGGSSICEHNKIRNSCRECNGSCFCEHNKKKNKCIICNPNCACRECKIILVDKRTQFYPLCHACFCNAYPDHEKSTLYKIKERYLRDELRRRFPDKDINMVFDKAVDGGCSKKRPDVLIDLLLYSIIIECDENQHKNYECENKRTMQLFEDLGNRPLILIRFNPDSYGSSEENNRKVDGCFKPLTKIEDIHKKKFYELNEEEWKRRVDILEKVIKDKISFEVPQKEIEEIKLFYNKTKIKDLD